MGVPPPPPLLLLLAHLGGAVLGAGALSILPSPSNIRYTFNESSCILNVTWDAVHFSSNSCNLMFHTALYDGEKWTRDNWISDLSREMEVPLGENLFFGLRTSCINQGNDAPEGAWLNISLAQNGTAGTGAANPSCVCHNAQRMVCSWKPGRSAPPGTKYHLSFWDSKMKNGQPCTDLSVDGETFRCTFPVQCYGLGSIAISVRGDSPDIQPMCMITKEGEGKSDYMIKPDPPSNLKVIQGSNIHFLTWTAPLTWNGICYEVEMNGKIDKTRHEDKTNVTISLEPKKYHTLRVRATLIDVSNHCSARRGLWSEWSEQVHWDDRDNNKNLTIALFIIIPLCAAVLTILLLVHLKRIQLLIFPIIPDPEKVLKRMLEDQREEYQSVGHPSEFIKPDIMKTDHKMS